jgi:hypothetical protein
MTWDVLSQGLTLTVVTTAQGRQVRFATENEAAQAIKDGPEGFVDIDPEGVGC